MYASPTMVVGSTSRSRTRCSRDCSPGCTWSPRQLVRRYAFTPIWQPAMLLRSSPAPGCASTSNLTTCVSSRPMTDPAPRVILLSLDAVGHTIISPETTPHLWELRTSGGWAPRGGQCDLPAVTYVSHATLATGTMPA